MSEGMVKVQMIHPFKKLQAGKVVEVDMETALWLQSRKYATAFVIPAKPAAKKKGEEQ